MEELRAKLAERVCVRERQGERNHLILRVCVWVRESVSALCSSLDWHFTHPLLSPSHPVYVSVLSLFPAACFYLYGKLQSGGAGLVGPSAPAVPSPALT